ncbi:MAG: hypothetical protein ACYTGC_06940, partial [Planctomycetota bacterium]
MRFRTVAALVLMCAVLLPVATASAGPVDDPPTIICPLDTTVCPDDIPPPAMTIPEFEAQGGIIFD